ncbi:MAG TPA: MFS transporter, partial [Acetobacteraceae bacterium]|nr:MFS transporter [Acetobacteraceae bacterium]
GGLAVMTAGLLLVLFLPAAATRLDIAWRLALCGVGFGFFQSPNNRVLIASAPPDRAGAGSGMLSTSRLVGQTTGSALVALVFGVTHGTAHAVAAASHICFTIAAGAAGLAMLASTLRLAQSRPGEVA